MNVYQIPILSSSPDWRARSAESWLEVLALNRTSIGFIVAGYNKRAVEHGAPRLALTVVSTAGSA